MKMEKFNISLEREILRCNRAMKISHKPYPKEFGNKLKNNFIGIKQKDYILNLKTPMSKNIIDVYDKLQEITNFVNTELYKIGEILWPFAQYKDLNLSTKIKLSINKNFYDEIRNINNNLPDTLEEAYTNAKRQFTPKSLFLNKLFGRCTLKITKQSIELSNIMNNYSTRIGITYDEVCFLVTFIFSLFEPNKSEELQDIFTKIAKYHIDFEKIQKQNF